MNKSLSTVLHHKKRSPFVLGLTLCFLLSSAATPLIASEEDIESDEIDSVESDNSSYEDSQEGVEEFVKNKQELKNTQNELSKKKYENEHNNKNLENDRMQKEDFEYVQNLNGTVDSYFHKFNIDLSDLNKLPKNIDNDQKFNQYLEKRARETKQKLLNLAKDSKFEQVSLEAFKYIYESEYLQDLSENSRWESIRNAASKRLNDMKNQVQQDEQNDQPLTFEDLQQVENEENQAHQGQDIVIDPQKLVMFSDIGNGIILTDDLCKKITPEDGDIYVPYSGDDQDMENFPVPVRYIIYANVNIDALKHIQEEARKDVENGEGEDNYIMTYGMTETEENSGEFVMGIFVESVQTFAERYI